MQKVNVFIFEIWLICEFDRTAVISDEYKEIVNDDKIARLEALVQAVVRSNSQTKQTLNMKTLTFAFYTTKLCDLFTVSPRGFNYTIIYKQLHILAGHHQVVQDTCFFFLESI